MVLKMQQGNLFESRKITATCFSVCKSVSKKSDAKFKIIDELIAKRIVSAMQRNTDNIRLNVEQFKKYYNDSRNKWFGLFEDGMCKSLAVLRMESRQGTMKNIILFAEIQSVIKGYGRPLILEILRRYPNIWWVAAPEGGNELLSYYRQFNGISEFKLGTSGLCSEVLTIFYRVFGKKRRMMFMDYLFKLFHGG